MRKSFAYVTSLRIPNEFANSIYVIKICEAASKLGWETFLLMPNKTQPAYFPHKNIYKYYKIKKGRFFIIKFKVVELNKMPQGLERIVKHLRHQFIIWTLMFQSLAYLLKNKIAVVETMDREIIFLLRLVFWYRPKIIYDIHIDPKTWYEKLFDWLIIPRVDLFMVNCNFFRKYYKSKIKSHQKIIKLPNGFDPQNYAIKTPQSKIRQQLKLPVNKFILGYIGRLETFEVNKGVPLMLKAAADLKKKMPIVVVIIGGPATLVKQYQHLAQKLNLSSNQAIIKNQVPPYQVAKYIKAFDVACMIYPDTDHYRHKMSPMKAIEYMAGKKPIIASSLPSITQILDYQTSYLIPPHSLSQLKKTIQAIFKQPRLAAQKAKTAHQQAKPYTWLNRQKQIFDKL